MACPPQSESSYLNQTSEVGNLSPKVCIFMWRASKDYIPTGAKFFLKHVPTNEMRLLCKFNVTTTSHCLLLCRLIKHVEISIFWTHLSSMQSETFY